MAILIGKQGLVVPLQARSKEVSSCRIDLGHSILLPSGD
jgi:hypothetical protein